MDLQVLSSDDIDSSLLGYADEVAEECIADDIVIMIKGAKITNSVSKLQWQYHLFIYFY